MELLIKIEAKQREILTAQFNGDFELADSLKLELKNLKRKVSSISLCGAICNV